MKDKAEQFFVPDTAQTHIKDQANVIIDRSKKGLIALILEEKFY